MKNIATKRILQISLSALLVAVTFVSLLACSKASESSNGSDDASAKDAKPAVKTLRVGFAELAPIAYEDEDGRLTGVDLEALKLIDELLPQYEFEYQRLDQTAVFAGLESGAIDIATTNSFWTEQRAEKYLFPQENLGMNIEGIIVNKDIPGIKSIADAATAGLSNAPILAGDGNHGILLQYNEKHPDNPVKIAVTDNNDVMLQGFALVASGEYDYHILPKQYFEFLVVNPEGSLHQYADSLYFEEFGSVRTWAIFRKDEVEEAAAFDTAVRQLKEDGKLSELALKFIGYDTWAYVSKGEVY